MKLFFGHCYVVLTHWAGSLGHSGANTAKIIKRFVLISQVLCFEAPWSAQLPDAKDAQKSFNSKLKIQQQQQQQQQQQHQHQRQQQQQQQHAKQRQRVVFIFI